MPSLMLTLLLGVRSKGEEGPCSENIQVISGSGACVSARIKYFTLAVPYTTLFHTVRALVYDFYSRLLLLAGEAVL